MKSLFNEKEVIGMIEDLQRVKRPGVPDDDYERFLKLKTKEARRRLLFARKYIDFIDSTISHLEEMLLEVKREGDTG